MVAMIVGLVLILFTIFSVLPAGLGWGMTVVEFLKGGIPVLAAFIGLVSLFIGVADIKDKKEAKREEKEAAEQEKETNQK